jgi:hypothetical protein
MAQTSTATGVGISRSSSTAGAVAIGGGNATGGSATGGAGGTASSSLTVNSNVPSVQTINSVASGTQTIKNVPTVFAPGLAAAGLETCLGSVSAGAGVVGTGATFGTTIPDPGCAARLDARTLWSFGLKKAAVARLCLMSDIYKSMPDVCAIYLPNPQSPGYVLSSIETEKPYAGGPILLVEGKTGRERLCNDYDEPGQRCRVWAYAVTHHSASSKKMVLRMGTTPTWAAKPSAVAAEKSATSTETTEGKTQ